jgi:hypothetical protein
LFSNRYVSAIFTRGMGLIIKNKWCSMRVSNPIPQARPINLCPRTPPWLALLLAGLLILSVAIGHQYIKQLKAAASQCQAKQ